MRSCPFCKMELKKFNDMQNYLVENIGNSKGAFRAFVKQDKEVVSETEYKLETDGVNLLEILNNDYIDFTKTISNDIIEVYAKKEVKRTLK